MKYALFALTLFLLPQYAAAAPSAPDSSVWAEPATAAPGTPIELNAFIYNNQSEEITYTVSFQNAAKEEVASGTGTIPPEVAKAIVGTWQQPKSAVLITAVVTKALTKQKKEVTGLHGEIATITVGVTEIKEPTKTTLPLPSKDAIYGFIGTYLSGLEAFRVEKAVYFENMRDTAKEKAGITTVRQFVVTSDIPGTNPDPVIAPVTDPNAGDYTRVIMGTSLATLFGNKAVFYITLVLLILFLIRFLFNRFI